VQVAALHGAANTRLEPAISRFSRYGWDGHVKGTAAGLEFHFPNGAKAMRVSSRDTDIMAKGVDLMAEILGKGEVESVDIMAMHLKDPRKYLLVMEGRGEIVGAAFGFFNSGNKAAQQIILTVKEGFRQQGVGGVLSACRLTIASMLAGKIENLSFVTSELVPEDTSIIAKIYRNPKGKGKGNAFAAKFAYPLPPLTNSWQADEDMVVLPHVLLMIPVSTARPSNHVPMDVFKEIVVGNQVELYGRNKARIIEAEIYSQLFPQKAVELVSLNDRGGRRMMKGVVEKWKETDIWTPNAVRQAIGAPLPGDIIK
jgi:hypothetical protein